MKRILILFLLFSFILFLQCSKGYFTPKKDTHLVEAYLNTTIPEQFKSYDAVVLNDSGQIDIKTSNKLFSSTYERIRVIKILNADGFKYSNVVIPYTKGNDISIRRAFTISPDGTIHPVLFKDVYDIPFHPNYVFYSDQMAKIFTFPNVTENSILYYEYVVKYSHITATSGWNFQSTIPILNSVFSIYYPPELNINYKLYGVEEPVESYDDPSAFKKYYKWKLTNVEPIKDEPHAGPLRNRLKRINFAPFGMNSWEDIAKWYSKMFYSQSIHKNYCISGLNEIGFPSDSLEMIKSLYRYIQKYVRYMAVEIGLGRFQPKTPDEVFLRKYGDCKDMVVMAYAYLSSKGIKCYPMLIPFKNFQIVDTSLATPLYFNHLILYIPDSDSTDLYLDFTSKTTPFGIIPSYLQGQTGFVVLPDQTGFLKTVPVVPKEKNRILDSLNLAIKNDTLMIRGAIKFTGNPADEFLKGLYNRNDRQAREIIYNYLEKKMPGIEINSFETAENIGGAGCFKIIFSGYHIPIKERDKRLHIFKPFSYLYRNSYLKFGMEKRENDFYFPMSFMQDIYVSIQTTGEWEVVTRPEKFNLTSEYGSLNTAYSQNDAGIEYSIHFTRDKIYIPLEEYDNFAKFIEQINKFGENTFVIENK
ncbi:MAG: hypothetical protein Kow00108_22460 [Calditrichia bacterium]